MDFTQEELAEKLNVSRQSVSKWEIGSVCTGIWKKLVALSEIFQVSTDHLLKPSELDQLIHKDRDAGKAAAGTCKRRTGKEEKNNFVSGAVSAFIS